MRLPQALEVAPLLHGWHVDDYAVLPPQTVLGEAMDVVE